jgi:hypothetical protein
VLRNDNQHPIELYKGRAYVQLVPTAYFIAAVGQFSLERLTSPSRLPSESANLATAMLPPSTPESENNLYTTEEELVQFLQEEEQLYNEEQVRGTGGFGSTDVKQSI